jgi:hypothetical protein
LSSTVIRGRPAQGKLQGDAPDLIPQIQINLCPARLKPVEGRAADLPQLAHAQARHRDAFLALTFDITAGRGLPINACSIRSSSMRCKHQTLRGVSTGRQE